MSADAGARTPVLVTGARGQLGRAIVREFASSGYEVLALTRAEFDVTDRAAVDRTVTRLQPAIVVNCAAYNAVDAAEDDAVHALEVNGLAVQSLAAAARRVGATFVHYSTDFVFDGDAATPYLEADAPNPGNVYGASKLVGEYFAAEVPRHYVLRLESLFGGAERCSTIDRIVDGVREDRECRVFADRTVSPSYIPDVTNATRALIECDAPAGVYHCVSAGFCTWLELAEEIARQLRRTARLVSVTTDSVPTRARRPKFCALSNAKLASVGVGMPPWYRAVAEHLRSIAVGPILLPPATPLASRLKR